MQSDLMTLERIMSTYGDEDSPAPPACRLCQNRQAKGANNFWSPSAHIQSNAHLKALPVFVPKGKDVEEWWQTFKHEGCDVFFNHITLELRVE